MARIMVAVVLDRDRAVLAGIDFVRPCPDLHAAARRADVAQFQDGTARIGKQEKAIDQIISIDLAEIINRFGKLYARSGCCWSRRTLDGNLRRSGRSIRTRIHSLLPMRGESQNRGERDHSAPRGPDLPRAAPAWRRLARAVGRQRLAR